MHARSLRSRKAAKGFVRSQNRLTQAFTSVLEPLEQRALLSAGDPLGTFFTDFGPGNTENGGQVFRLPDQKKLPVGKTTTTHLIPVTKIALAKFNVNSSDNKSRNNA